MPILSVRGSARSYGNYVVIECKVFFIEEQALLLKLK